ncbi:MAG: hypothetical protein HY001_01580 [Candidatus Portnoybacteria bacterium]|nr:hypothetical protein [Candidatus Portnoybacteria bacterium]
MDYESEIFARVSTEEQKEAGNWLCILKIARTHFAACGGGEAPPASAAPPRR